MTICPLEDDTYVFKYHHKNHYSFFYILTKLHLKMIKNKEDTAKSLA